MIQLAEMPGADELVDARAHWGRCLFDHADDAQFVCDRTGLVHELNRRAAQWLGFPRPDETRGFLVTDLLTPAMGKRLLQLIQRRAGPPATLASVTVLARGKISFIGDVQATPVGHDTALVSFKDASQRWRMESHLQRLVAAMDATTDVFFLTNADFKLIYVNSAFQDVTGHTIEDALGRTADFLRAPSEAAKTRDYLEHVSRGAVWRGELLNVHNDGTTYPVEANISPIHDKQGELIGYVACERDITAKKNLQDQVLLERDFVQSIVNSLDSAVYTVDRQFRLTHANEGWRKFPGIHGWLTFDAPPQLGRPLLDHVKDPVRRMVLQTAFETVLVQRQPLELQDPGNGFPWSVRIAPWLHAGEVIGLIYHVADQTRFHDLQKQLFQAQKMETVGALAAGVAHDFNNLLQVIQGNASLLAREERPDEHRNGRLHQIEQAASRAADITRQLLSFSRVSEERVTVFDFNEAIAETGRMAERSLRGNVELKLNPAPAPMRVKMDATRAQQLLLNLCVNAQDAMPSGGQLTLTNQPFRLTSEQATKTPYPPDTHFVRCSVADTGTGIPPEILSRIFNPFFTTKETGKGTGLGLSIAHSVVQQVGGFLEVESAPGLGTTFHIHLPLADGGVVESTQSPPQRSLKGSGRVLVADDLDLIREFTQTFLETAGFTVAVVADAQEALAALAAAAEPFDLLLSDYNMPGMNGIELLQEVSARWPGTRLILASGYLDESDKASVAAVGASILGKPYNMGEAVELIMNLLRKDERSG